MKQVMIFGDGKSSRGHLGKIIRKRANQVLIEYDDWDYNNEKVIQVQDWFQRRSYYNTQAKYESRNKENLWYYDRPLGGYAAMYYMSANCINYGENAMLDTALLSDAESIYFHALCNIKGPFPEGIETLKKSPTWLFEYITTVPNAYDIDLVNIVLKSSDHMRKRFIRWFLTKT